MTIIPPRHAKPIQTNNLEFLLGIPFVGGFSEISALIRIICVIIGKNRIYPAAILTEWST